MSDATVRNALYLLVRNFAPYDADQPPQANEDQYKETVDALLAHFNVTPKGETA